MESTVRLGSTSMYGHEIDLKNLQAKISFTIDVIPSGYKKRLYKESTVLLGSTSVVFWSRIGPVSKPSSAQKILKPAFLSPFIRVLQHKEFHVRPRNQHAKGQNVNEILTCENSTFGLFSRRYLS